MSRHSRLPVVIAVLLSISIGIEFGTQSAFSAVNLPDGMSGFSGTLRGQVAAVGKEAFSLKVSKVVRTWKKNRAENPQSAVGKSLELIAKNKFHVNFIRTLKKGEGLDIEAKADGGKLFILELNNEQRVRAGVKVD